MLESVHLEEREGDWDKIYKLDLKEVGYENRRKMKPARDDVLWRALVLAVMNLTLQFCMFVY